MKLKITFILITCLLSLITSIKLKTKAFDKELGVPMVKEILRSIQKPNVESNNQENFEECLKLLAESDKLTIVKDLYDYFETVTKEKPPVKKTIKEKLKSFGIFEPSNEIGMFFCENILTDNISDETLKNINTFNSINNVFVTNGHRAPPAKPDYVSQAISIDDIKAIDYKEFYAKANGV
jgi:hypothetical protein